MTVATLPALRSRLGAVPATAVVALGSLALSLRRPSAGAVAVLAAVGLAALLTPAPAGSPATPRRTVAVTAAGTAAFAAARLLGPSVALPATVAGAGASVLAAVAEEALFRRLAFGWLERFGGAALATALTAAAFAIVHVPQYGVGVLPLDAAAGALFGWQRWATGSWAAPAATHAAANLIQLI